MAAASARVASRALPKFRTPGVLQPANPADSAGPVSWAAALSVAVGRGFAG
jgi:hypothetical protein